MSVPYIIEREDLDALIEALESVPNPSVDAQRLLLGAMLNRRNNDRSFIDREIAILEASLNERVARPRRRLRDLRPGG